MIEPTPAAGSGPERIKAPNIKDSGTKPDSLVCPQCKAEFYKLYTDVCYDCTLAKEQDVARSKRLKEKMASVFGGAWATEQLAFDTFIEVKGAEKAFKACRNFDPASDNLYLWGACGRGKTHLAVAAAFLQMLAGSDVGFFTSRELINTFRLKEPAEELAQIRKIAALPVLVIDDLGITRGTDFAIDILCDILNKRFYQNRNGLIITSNLFVDELAEKMGDHRLASRIGGMCKVIEMKGDNDMRLRSKK